jgi:3-deoxy-D-manno-octulosonic-acid transferase/heptosyltransferase-1
MTEEKINLGGATTLSELACLYKRARMLITTDSGPMHLAAAAGIPVIALFGPTDPARTGPYGAGHTVLRTQMACSPCFLKKCSTKQCMKDITPRQVFAAIEKTLNKE